MPSPTDSETRAAALVMLDKGHSCQTVATALGLSRQTVWRWQQAAGGQQQPEGALDVAGGLRPLTEAPFMGLHTRQGLAVEMARLWAYSLPHALAGSLEDSRRCTAMVDGLAALAQE